LTDLRKIIEEVAAPVLNPIGAFIVDIQVVPGNGRKVVQLFVDTDTGITIDQCAEMSKQLAVALELQEVIPSSFVLQVSSPGLDKPLRLLRQYRKNVGRRFRVRFKANNDLVEISAMLNAIEGEILVFLTENHETYTIPYTEIIESIEELSW